MIDRILSNFNPCIRNWLLTLSITVNTCLILAVYSFPFVMSCQDAGKMFSPPLLLGVKDRHWEELYNFNIYVSSWKCPSMLDFHQFWTVMLCLWHLSQEHKEAPSLPFFFLLDIWRLKETLSFWFGPSQCLISGYQGSQFNINYWWLVMKGIMCQAIFFYLFDGWIDKYLRGFFRGGGGIFRDRKEKPLSSTQLMCFLYPNARNQKEWVNKFLQ